MFKRFFQHFKKQTPDIDAAAEEAWHEQLTGLMEQTLGGEHDMVMHAIIPYSIGGGLDLYYFPNHIPGVGIATKELTHAGPTGPNNAVMDAFELVMFTHHPLNLDDAKDESTAFGKIHMTINAILNTFAPYSEQATLNPNETCEFPEDMESVGGKCFILDAYGTHRINGKTVGLMVVIEIFRSEMVFARQQRGADLLHKLKDAGAYPYSDLDRKPVI